MTSELVSLSSDMASWRSSALAKPPPSAGQLPFSGALWLPML